MKLIILIFSFFNIYAWATPECDYSLFMPSINIQLNDTIQVIQQNVTLLRTGSPSFNCENYRIFFGKGFANSYQRLAYSSSNRTVTYNLHSSINMSGVLKDFGDALSSNEYLEGQAPTLNTTFTNKFFVSAPGLSTQNSPVGGVYRDNIQANLYSYNPNSNKFEFERVTTMAVSLIVSEKIDLSIVEEGGAFDPSSTSKVLDFGFLQRNQEKGVDLRVISNTSYEIRLSSQNNGTLKLDSSDTIAYQMKANGTLVAFSSSPGQPISIGGAAASNGATGDRYNIRVKINEDTQNKKAGTYQDVITITAIAN